MVPIGVNFIAAYDFQGEVETDLSFAAGETVLVTKQEGEWWEGVVNGKSGIFPASFVENPESPKSEVTLVY